MVELIEEIDADQVEPLGDVGRFAEPALPRQDLEVSGLEFYTHTEGHVAFLPESSTDHVS